MADGSAKRLRSLEPCIAAYLARRDMLVKRELSAGEFLLAQMRSASIGGVVGRFGIRNGFNGLS